MGAAAAPRGGPLFSVLFFQRAIEELLWMTYKFSAKF
jgi:hypothetical protein